MKKVLVAAACCVLASLVWAQTEVHSVNVAGVVKVPVKGNGGFTLVGINMDAFDVANATLMGVLGNNQLTPGARPSQCDQVWTWDGTQYNLYGLKTSDMQWHDASGYPNPWTNTPVNPTLIAGDAMWIVTLAGSADKSVTLTGQAVATASQTITVNPGFNFISYPLSSAISIQNTAFKNDGAKAGSRPSQCDQIWAWDGNQYALYGLKSSDMLWHDASGYPNPWTNVPVNVSFDLGSGFWYVRTDTNSFNWVEANPYIGNL